MEIEEQIMKNNLHHHSTTSSLRVLVLVALLTTGTLAFSQDKLYHNTFALSDVELLDSPFKHAQDLNVKTLLQYDMDRLLAPFLKEAGLEPKGEYFPNWQGLDGHVGGHYLSALAIHYASTGNEECLTRLKYCLNELQRCQEANADGYIGGVPNGKFIFAEVAKGNFGPLHGAWVPWYNVHKTMAGLRDAWQYADLDVARILFLKMCDWCLNITGGLTDEQMDQMVSQEFGGMDEVLADAYAMTGEERYLTAAKRFAHHLILDSMAAGIDNLDNKHANTQVPKAVGYARIADLANDTTFSHAATFFWDCVANHRSVVIGGNSRSEHFPAAADYISYMEHREGPESCNTNNMLKLTQFLFAMDPQAAYADFYERALYNHILSTQHPDHGGYVYFTPMRPGHYRVYSQPNSGMWCCVGTGMENHGKYGEFIYTHDGNRSLHVNLFIPSRLTWRDAKAVITQETFFPYAESSRLTLSLKRARRFTLYVRCPEWVAKSDGDGRGFSIKVDGKEYAAAATPSSYVAINRRWHNGDVVEIALPMRTRVEALDHEPDYLAVLRGPIVLAARTGQERLDGLVADDGRWGHIAHGPLVPLAETPIMKGSRQEIERRLQTMRPVPGQPLHYTVPGLWGQKANDDLVLEPFFSLHDSRYAIYFLSLTDQGYDDMLRRIREDEEARLLLDRRTVDRVVPGEQQPEVDHRMAGGEQSVSGYQDNSPYRTPRRNGTFSYELSVPADAEGLSLAVGYWGRGSGPSAVIDITVDGQPLIHATEFPNIGSAAVAIQEYPLPASCLTGKQYVRIGFSAADGNPAPRIFDVRMVKK